MKVYILIDGYSYEGNTIVGVYTSFDKASSAAHEIMGRTPDFWKSDAANIGYWKSGSQYLEIEEQELQ